MRADYAQQSYVGHGATADVSRRGSPVTWPAAGDAKPPCPNEIRAASYKQVIGGLPMAHAAQ
ncbi:hypothetical protein [Granulicella sp. L60]|uniref:hypothetical protein n=1 Tax=Granulicella sp. L60 TaxID=1641866 RepID=UPI00131A896F|nr:hypothetical protein [Granulicella sp. L60]